MSQPNLYDEIAYPTEAYRQTHPDRLATTGVLMGMSPTPPSRCRVLELGCGSGANLISMALTLPDSEFVGIDLAAVPVAQARSGAADSGLRNVTFLERDLLNGVADLGRFDYVIAQGIYSWVAAPVRDGVLALCNQCLTEQGIAFISYTVYPGAYHRRMVREMLLHHAPSSLPARQQLDGSHELLTFLAEAMPTPAGYREILQQEKNLFESLGEGHYLHDNLSRAYEAVYFHEFVGHAKRHRLQFVGDSAVSRSMRGLYPQEVIDKLQQLAPDRLAREQYRDFLDGRIFRESLLCREEIHLAEEPRREHFQELNVLAPAKAVPAPAGSPASVGVWFQVAGGKTMHVDHPLAAAALAVLSESCPIALSFLELLSRTQARLPDTEAPALAEILLIVEGSGLVELSVSRPTQATCVSERPVSSPQARWQIRRGKPVTNLWQCPIKMDDPVSRHLLKLLDGSRDQAALVAELAAFMVQQQLFPRQKDTLIREPAALRRLLAEHMNANLERFVRLGLLTA